MAPCCCKFKFDGTLVILVNIDCALTKITLSIPVDLMKLVCCCHLSCAYCTPHRNFQYIYQKMTFHYILGSISMQISSASYSCILGVDIFTYVNDTFIKKHPSIQTGDGSDFKCCKHKFENSVQAQIMLFQHLHIVNTIQKHKKSILEYSLNLSAWSSQILFIWA